MERTSSFNSFAKPAKPATYGFVPAPYNKELTPSNLTASKYSMNSMSRESLSSTAVLISTPKLARQNASPHSTPRSFPFGQDEESELGFMLPASPSRCHEASISPFRRPGDGMVDVPLNDLRPSGTTSKISSTSHPNNFEIQFLTCISARQSTRSRPSQEEKKLDATIRWRLV